MRGLFLTLTVFVISACSSLPPDIAKECSNRVLGLIISADEECAEAAFTRKYEAECTANPKNPPYRDYVWMNGRTVAVATSERAIKERNHQICVEQKQIARAAARIDYGTGTIRSTRAVAPTPSVG